MPTKRARHVLTESDDLAKALSDAARYWPADKDSPARLLMRLVKRGHCALVGDQQNGVQKRKEAIRATSGRLTGLYGPGYLEDLRKDWPA